MAAATTRGAGSRPLLGFRVGIAAHRGSQEQADALRRAGAEPVVGAVLGPVPSARIEALEAVTEDLLARPPSVVVLTSAAGIEGWLGTAEGAGRGSALRDALAGATVLAQGDAAAASSALDVAVAATLPPGGVEGGAQLARLTGGLTGARVAVQVQAGHPAGQATAGLVAGLVTAGIDVVDVAVPVAPPAEDSQAALRLLEAVVEQRVDALTFTAPDEVRGFVALAVGAGAGNEALAALSGDVVPACMGPACAQVATSAGFRGVIQPERARVGAMVEVLGEQLGTGVVRLELGGVDVVIRGALALVDDEEVWLADRERGLLEALARRPGTVVAKAELLRRVWRSDGIDGAEAHAVEVAVARLRRRLGPAGAGLQTVPRRGYRLVSG
ncbi:MAG: uroporphyrinogen-III synthase [Actinobacteria bacterium]|nr:uroporphyrinogen-III synthase [Actinomycetota bacterium]